MFTATGKNINTTKKYGLLKFWETKSLPLPKKEDMWERRVGEWGEPESCNQTEWREVEFDRVSPSSSSSYLTRWVVERGVGEYRGNLILVLVVKSRFYALDTAYQSGILINKKT